MNNDRAMSILAHFDELKRRMFRVAVVLVMVLATILVLEYRLHYITDFMTEPARQLLAGTGAEPSRGEIVFLRVTEPWAVAAKVSFIATFFIVLPYLLVEIALFLRPGLNPNERKYLYLLPPGVVVAFGAGMAFGYYVIMPFFLRFLIDLGSQVATPQISIAFLVGQIMAFVFWMGIIFQLPVAMFLVAKMGFITHRKLATKRRWVILGAFIMGAAITPTIDPVTQLLVAGPIMMLFEIGLFLVKIAERKPEESSSTVPSS